jgi:arabinose-5-phosphate isomerase
MNAAKPALQPPAGLQGGSQEADLAAARRVLGLASDALAALSAGLNGAFSRAIETMLAAKGRIIVSGMGKSGHVGRKVAATLSSTGTPAHFVHPAEASHGDMGAITPGDVLLLLSKGGETEELANLLTYAKRFHIPIIAIACRDDSTLMRAADVALLLPDAPESCAIGMAPTTSTTMMIALGDALAVALMERRGFDADRYRDFHPGGSLGRALIRVSDLMHKGADIPLCGAQTPMQDVLLAMASGRLGCVGIVAGDGTLAGIVTDGDIRRHAGKGLEGRTAADVMTRNPKVTEPAQLAAEALALMTEKKITQLFVLDAANRPVGVLHIHDCLRAGLA